MYNVCILLISSHLNITELVLFNNKYRGNSHISSCGYVKRGPQFQFLYTKTGLDKKNGHIAGNKHLANNALH